MYSKRRLCLRRPCCGWTSVPPEGRALRRFEYLNDLCLLWYSRKTYWAVFNATCLPACVCTVSVCAPLSLCETIRDTPAVIEENTSVDDYSTIVYFSSHGLWLVSHSLGCNKRIWRFKSIKRLILLQRHLSCYIWRCRTWGYKRAEGQANVTQLGVGGLGIARG